MRTGYFGKIDENRTRITKVHLVEDGQPMCGSTVAPDMKFHFCCHGAQRPDYLTCKKCADLEERMYAEHREYLRRVRIR